MENIKGVKRVSLKNILLALLKQHKNLKMSSAANFGWHKWKMVLVLYFLFQQH